jgi:O-antigen ligase
MVIVVPVALAFGLAGKRDARRTRSARTWRDRLREWNSTAAGPTRLLPVLIMVMGGAALVSGSRGGVVALVAALLAMILGSLARGRSWSRQAARVALATVLIVLAGIWIGGDIVYGTVERLAKEVSQVEHSERLRIWADALRLWRDAPLSGTGLATFGVAFPRVRTLQTPVVYSHAESDWVQLLTDTGALGLGVAIAAAGTVAHALLRRYRHADSRRARVLSLAGFVAVIGIVIQGIANYNLPVMSNFIYLAIAVTVAGGPTRSAGDRDL